MAERCTHANGCCQRHPNACRGHRADGVSEQLPNQERPFWLARGNEEQRRIALAAHRSYSDQELLPSPSRASAACPAAALVMLENRPLVNASHYWNKVIALNYLYAQRHGYQFFLMAPRRSGSDAKGVYYSWCKIDTLATLAARLAPPPSRPVARAAPPPLPPPCSPWLVFLDSDAYIREQFMSVSQLLATLGPAARGAELVIGREKDVQVPASGGSGAVAFQTAFALNTGVLFLSASNWTRELLSGWSSLQFTVCKGKFFRRQAEQKCFERLLTDQRHMLPRGAEERIVHAPMQAFNSPWGRYARHIWGGEGASLRSTVFDDELRVQGVWTAAQQMALVDEARRRSERTC